MMEGFKKGISMGKIGTVFQHSGTAPGPAASLAPPLDIGQKLALLNALTEACLPGYRWQAHEGPGGPAARLCPDADGGNEIPEHLRRGLSRAFAQGGLALEPAGTPQLGGPGLAALAGSAGRLRSEIARNPDLNGMNLLESAAAEGRKKRAAPDAAPR